MPDASTEPIVTVIVCSYNGAKTLGACLDALARQTVSDRAQIVVVDDGSTDATAEVAGHFDVEIVVHATNLGISKARNSGLAVARAPIVAFTDDDCIPTDSWLETLLAAYDDAHVVAVGGSTEVAHVETYVHRYLVEYNPLLPLELDLGTSSALARRLGLYVLRMWRPGGHVGPRHVYSFPGANMSFRRDALEAVGGFESRMTFGADDEYICGRLRAAHDDLVLWYVPAAVVRHDYVGTVRDVWRRNRAYGRGHARAYLLGKDQRWPIIFPMPIAVPIAVALLRRSRWLVLVPFAVPLLLPQGLLASFRRRRPEYVLFSYLRLLEESAHNVGMVVGLLRARSERSARGI